MGEYVTKKNILAGTVAMFLAVTVATASAAEAKTVSQKRSLVEQAMQDKWWALHTPIGEKKIVGTSPVSKQIHGNESTLRPGATYNGVSCRGRVENRHRSQKNGGIRPRLRVKCTGPADGPETVAVKVFGYSAFAAASSSAVSDVAFESRGSTNGLIKVVTVNGAGERFILNHKPWRGSNVGTGHWRTTATWQIVSPNEGSIGSSAETSWAAVRQER